MKEYCRDCRDRGGVICELPKQGEPARRFLGMAAAAGVDLLAIAGTGLAGIGEVSSYQDFELTKAARDGVAAMRTRVDSCIGYHERQDAAEDA